MDCKAKSIAKRERNMGRVIVGSDGKDRLRGEDAMCSRLTGGFPRLFNGVYTGPVCGYIAFNQRELADAKTADGVGYCHDIVQLWIHACSTRMESLNGELSWSVASKAFMQTAKTSNPERFIAEALMLRANHVKYLAHPRPHDVAATISDYLKTNEDTMIINEVVKEGVDGWYKNAGAQARMGSGPAAVHIEATPRIETITTSSESIRAWTARLESGFYVIGAWSRDASGLQGHALGLHLHDGVHTVVDANNGLIQVNTAHLTSSLLMHPLAYALSSYNMGWEARRVEGAAPVPPRPKKKNERGKRRKTRATTVDDAIAVDGDALLRLQGYESGE